MTRQAKRDHNGRNTFGCNKATTFGFCIGPNVIIMQFACLLRSGQHAKWLVKTSPKTGKPTKGKCTENSQQPKGKVFTCFPIKASWIDTLHFVTSPLKEAQSMKWVHGDRVQTLESTTQGLNKTTLRVLVDSLRLLWGRNCSFYWPFFSASSPSG